MSPLLDEAGREGAFEALRGALNSNSLILLAGSGLSAQASTDDGRHPPLWRGLLEGMVDWCMKQRLLSGEHAQSIRELVLHDFLTEAGQELEENVEKPYLHQCLARVLLCNEAKIGEAHHLIAQIPFRAYLTTNYDEFIEGAYWAERGVALRKFYEDSCDGALACFRETIPFILKLHGDVSSSIVLGDRAYDRLLYGSNKYRSNLESLFAVSSVLLVGFGGSDPDLKGIIDKVAVFDGRSKRHWMLIPKDVFPHLKAKRLWKDRGINVIEYEVDTTHSGVVKFLRTLATPQPLAPAGPQERGKTKSLASSR